MPMNDYMTSYSLDQTAKRYNYTDYLKYTKNLTLTTNMAHTSWPELKNINHNYFEFATLAFQQIHGTAMGAATINNIFMSVTLHRFLRTHQHKPLLLKRYIDDILTRRKLTKFSYQH